MSSKKGIVLETGKGWAIILMPDGQYKKVRTNRMLAVGELYKAPSHIPQYTAAAVLLVFLTIGIVDYFSVVAYARLSPGIEIGINRWERVVLVQKDNTWNELDKLKLKGKSLDDAVVTIVDEVLSSEEPAVTDLQQGLTVSVTSSKVEPRGKAEEKLLGKIDVALEKAAERKTRNSKHYRIQRENNNLVIMAEAVVKTPKEVPPGLRQKGEKDWPDKENKTEEPTKPSKRESNPGKISPDPGAKPAKTDGEPDPTDKQRTNPKEGLKDKGRDTSGENNKDQKQQEKEKGNKDNQQDKDQQKDKDKQKDKDEQKDKDKQKDEDQPGQRDKGKYQDDNGKDQGKGERKDSRKIPFPWNR